MIQLKEPEKKTIRTKRIDGAWVIYCPGCKFLHRFEWGWWFDGDIENPTFTPSLKVIRRGEKDPCCHFILTKGKMHFCDDCQHELRNQTVDLPELPK